MSTKPLLQNRFAHYGVIALVCLFPFAINNAYFNITYTKYVSFCLISAFALSACLIAAISEKTEWSLKKLKLSLTDIMVAGFTLVAVVSTVISDYPSAAFSGAGGRYMGLIAILALLFAYVFISRYYKISEKDFVLFGVSFSLMCGFAYIQFLGFDPFGFLSGVSYEWKCKFIGFIGNINVFSSYISLLLPMFMCMFCYSVTKLKSVVYGLFCSLGFIGLIISNSDNGYIGIGIAFVILAFVTVKYKKQFVKLLKLILVFGVSSVVMFTVRSFFEVQARSLSFLGRAVTNRYIQAAVIVGSLLLIVLFSVLKLDKLMLNYGRKILAAMVALAACGVLCLFVLFSFINRETDIGMLEPYLRFNDAWGSDRGGIWSRVMDTFGQLPWYHKLFGTGPDTLAFAVVDKLGLEAYSSLGFAFDNAHNDLLQYLVTMGVFGALFYLLTVITAVAYCAKKQDSISTVLLVCICSYFIQSLFSITQPIVTPLFFVFIAFARSKSNVS